VLDRVASALRAASDELLLVANDPAGDAWLPGVRRVGDLRAGLGPLSGIHAALTYSNGDVLVVAWDMPFVSPALLVELRRQRAAHAAVVPESTSGRLEPTCAFYTTACVMEIERWLDSGRSEATAFVEQLPGAHRVPVAEVARFGDPARLFFNINTPAALHDAEALAARSE
jgi:molybdenum cofactor guanylyltransferase